VRAPCVSSPPEAIRALFRYADMPNFPPRHNVAPTQPVAIVRLMGVSVGSQVYEVSIAVNRVANDNPALLERAALVAATEVAPGRSAGKRKAEDDG